jgi:ketosteroid isomerase-like protein
MANQELLQQFYAAFADKNGEAMASCYAPQATFTDPVFVGLKDGEPGAMWRMLTSRSKDLVVELVSCEADESSGSAHWIATYTFAQTGRRVVNDVRSSFRFAGGQIVEQRDDFDFHRWSAQALGLPGKLLGGTPVIKSGVRRKARAGACGAASGSRCRARRRVRRSAPG